MGAPRPRGCNTPGQACIHPQGMVGGRERENAACCDRAACSPIWGHLHMHIRAECRGQGGGLQPHVPGLNSEDWFGAGHAMGTVSGFGLVDLSSTCAKLVTCETFW